MGEGTRAVTRAARAARRFAWLSLAVTLIGLAGTGPVTGAAGRTAGTERGEQAATAGRSSLDLRATYEVAASIELATGRISVRSTMDVLNTSGGRIDRLELNTLAAVLGGMSEPSATVNGRPVRVDHRGQTLIVPLPGGLRSGSRARVTVRYRARFRASTGGDDWLWSRSHGVISAYRWIPWVSRRVRFDRPNHGDPFVTPVSPRVRVALTTDRPAIFATSGRQVARSGTTRTFVARDVRDFNLTVSAGYRLLSGRSTDGETRIRVLTRTTDSAAMLAWARRALRRYEALVGEYAYPTLTIAESSGGYAMESPALIWIPRGTPSSRLPYLVAHETAHQWFYAAVGSDQADEPFADEALADLLARTMLDQWRPSRCPKSRLDLTIYRYSDACYYEVVYVQGARYLDAMRRRMGGVRFWDALGGYYRANRTRLSNTKRLLEALRAAATYDPLPSYRERFPRYY